MKQPISLVEGGAAQRVQLTSAEYSALQKLSIVNVIPTTAFGWYEVEAGRKIGAVRVGDRDVIVRPKIADINRLAFLLGYTPGKRNIWRDDQVRLSEADELLPAIGEAFSRLATGAIEQGLLQGYKAVSDLVPVIRGRVIAKEQMGRRFGMLLPVAVEYDDFTVDIAENQILLAAALKMLNVPRLGPAARQRIQRLRVAMADVTVPARGSMLPLWTPTRLNARYHAALRIAQVVLAGKSFEHRIGDLVVTGFMFDMWQVFEDFVTVALGEALSRIGGKCVGQGRVHLDDDRRVVMKPDILWLRGGETMAVIDAKYKAERPAGFPDADLYQMLAYCTALGLDDGHLVYAKGNEPVRSHIVRNAGVRLHCHALDLTLEPGELLDAVDELAQLIQTRTID